MTYLWFFRALKQLLRYRYMKLEVPSTSFPLHCPLTTLYQVLYSNGSGGQLYEMQDPQFRRQLMKEPCINEIKYFFLLLYDFLFLTTLGPGVAQWLRRCGTSRKVPVSIPSGVTGFFSDIFPFDRTFSLGSTQPVVKMSTRNIPWGKGGRCVRLTSLPSCAESHEIWEPKPPGTLWATPGLLYLYLYLLFLYIKLGLFNLLGKPVTGKCKAYIHTVFVPTCFSGRPPSSGRNI